MRSTGACGAIVLLACSSSSSTGGGASGQLCDSVELASECPVGSTIATFDPECSDKPDGVVLSVDGVVTRVCRVRGGCELTCYLQSPCLCGVASASDSRVECKACVAACGNGLCEPGETALACAPDCGARCATGELRCYGANRETCDDRGVWAASACPEGQVCDDGASGPRCAPCDVQNPPTWHVDRDGDGLGNANGATLDSCAPPARFVGNALDCNDDLFGSGCGPGGAGGANTAGTGGNTATGGASGAAGGSGVSGSGGAAAGGTTGGSATGGSATGGSATGGVGGGGGSGVLCLPGEPTVVSADDPGVSATAGAAQSPPEFTLAYALYEATACLSVVGGDLYREVESYPPPDNLSGWSPVFELASDQAGEYLVSQPQLRSALEAWGGGRPLIYSASNGDQCDDADGQQTALLLLFGDSGRAAVVTTVFGC